MLYFRDENATSLEKPRLSNQKYEYLLLCSMDESGLVACLCVWGVEITQTHTHTHTHTYTQCAHTHTHTHIKWVNEENNIKRSAWQMKTSVQI